MNENVQKMKEQLAQLKEEAATKTAELVEVSRLKAQIAIFSSEDIIKAQAAKTVRTATSDKLKQLDATCEEIVRSLPIFSSRTKENRKWNPSRQYGLGNQVATLTGILSGIQYSVTEHREQMLALTGLDEDFIEETLEAFGSTAYYSQNYDMVIDEMPYDMNKLVNNIALIEQALDIQLDKTKLTESVMSNRFEVARIRAERAKEEVTKGIALAGTIIDTE